jgi:uncharacterized protein (TIGR03437 family)
MLHQSSRWGAALLLALALPAAAGTFGRAVAIGGQSSDLALDESRGVLYIANFTANRIDVMSLSDYTIQTSINVAPQPSSIAMSPDNRFLVITHFGNFAPPATSSNALTVIDLTTSGKQSFALGNPPLGVAFGIDGRALVVTTTDYLLFDPVLGTTQEIDTISGVVAKTLPVPPANFPPQITTASMTSSGDGLTIFGMGGSTSTFTFVYDVTSQSLKPGGIVTSNGALGPKVISANQDGSVYMAGWTMVDAKGIANYIPQSTNQFNVGTSVFDSARGLVYTQIPTKIGAAPVLTISDADNLTVRERLQLPENTAGKSILSSDGKTLYAVSDSGVLVMNVGNLAQTPRLAASAEDLVFRGNFCSRGVTTQQLTITDPGGGSTAFSISSNTSGINVSPSTGVTPATVTVSVDANAFAGQAGTSIGTLTLSSSKASNIPPTVRVLVNSKSPEQRGTIVDVPGALTDLIADPQRSRFYLIRQDKNQVQVYDGVNYTLKATMRTGNMPQSMAITFDRRYLLVGNAAAQYVNVYDLETLQSLDPIRMPSGHTALSIAASANAILAATQYFDGTHHIVRLDLNSRSGVQPASLGVFNNLTDANVALVASPNGSSILAVEGDGSVMLYDAVQDTFTVSRKDFTGLSGAYAASSFNQYLAGNYVLNTSLVPVMTLESSSGTSSGFAFVDQAAFRTTVPVAASATGGSGTGTTTTTTTTTTIPTGPSSAAGIVQRLDLTNPTSSITRATRMAEASLVGTTGLVSNSPFSRTLAPLYDRSAIINLTVSGFTVLAWNYDASVAPPQISKVVNAADMKSAVAPGGLISLFGQQLSPTNLATTEIPVPTALGDSCLTVNGLPVPMLFVSPSQINAQMPFETVGNVTMILRTPGGVSDNFNLVVSPGAPAVFSAAIPGAAITVPTVVRNSNSEFVTGSNPIHRGDDVIIYLTGLGQTSPAATTGLPGPSSPPASALNLTTVTLGGAVLPLSFAGLAPGQVGVYQINAKVPVSVPVGLSIPLNIVQAGYSTSVSVRVIE